MMKAIYQKPANAELKKFGLVFSVFLILLFGVLIPVIKHWRAPGSMFSSFEYWSTWPWGLAFAITVWALIHPKSLVLLHRPWMKFAEVAGWINTRIIMLILFYLIIMPMGVVMRMFGYDPMRRKIDKNLDSYRVISTPQDRSHMKAPY